MTTYTLPNGTRFEADPEVLREATTFSDLQDEHIVPEAVRENPTAYDVTILDSPTSGSGSSSGGGGPSDDRVKVAEANEMSEPTPSGPGSESVGTASLSGSGGTPSGDVTVTDTGTASGVPSPGSTVGLPNPVEGDGRSPAVVVVLIGAVIWVLSRVFG